MNKRILMALLLAGSTVFIPATQSFAQEEKTAIAKEQAQEQVQRTVWGVKVSPYVRKVLVTLEEKRIPYKLEEILPGKLLKALNKKVPASFAKVSPFGKIPAYEEINAKGQSFSVSESDAIMNYLEKTNNSVSLRPNCPKADARVTFFIRYADDTLATVTHKVALIENVVKPKVLNQPSDSTLVHKALTEELPPMLDFLEATLKDDRNWIADTKNISLADIAIVSHLSSLIDSGLKIEEVIGTHRPKLLAYVQKILARESFKKAMSA